MIWWQPRSPSLTRGQAPITQSTSVDLAASFLTARRPPAGTRLAWSTEAFAAELSSLWQRLRLMVITQLWAAYCGSCSQPRQLPSVDYFAAGMVSVAMKQTRARGWVLVSSDIRIRTGVLSNWLKGRRAHTTAEPGPGVTKISSADGHLRTRARTHTPDGCASLGYKQALV